MNNIKVSVFCIVYNHEKYLEKCLQGIVMQKTNFDFEVLVHDDASTDNSKKIIQEYAKKYPDLIVPICQKENVTSKGININEDVLMPIAKGKYIALIEGDDFWSDENKLQLQYESLENNKDCSICTHKTLCSNEDGTLNGMSIPNKKCGLVKDTKLTRKEFAKKLFFYGYVFHTSSYFIRREVFEEKVELENRDISFLRRCLLKGGVYYISSNMSVYRMFSIGSYNSNIKKAGISGRLNALKNDLKIDIDFDNISNRQFHNYVIISELNNILYWGEADRDNALRMIKELNISCKDILGTDMIVKRLKLLIKYYIFTHFKGALKAKL